MFRAALTRFPKVLPKHKKNAISTIASYRLFSRDHVNLQKSPYEEAFNKRAELREEYIKKTGGAGIYGGSKGPRFKIYYVTIAVFMYVFYRLGWTETDREKMARIAEVCVIFWFTLNLIGEKCRI